MDKTKQSIVCDGCDKQLIELTACPHKYYLALVNQDGARHSEGSPIYSIAQRPRLEGARHFCDLKCLTIWLIAQGMPFPKDGE